MHYFSFRRFMCAIVVATVWLVPSPLRADDAPKAPANPPVVITQTGKCLMWKVSSGTATVYLVGSIHMATPDMYPLPKEMEAAFAKSDVLVVEVNMNKTDQAKTMQFMQAHGMYQGADTLTAHISKEAAKALGEFCTGLGLPAAAFDKLKPWVVSLTVEVMAIQKLGLDPKLGIDMHFLDLAGKQNKTIEELESSEFQLNLLSSFAPELQIKALDAALDEVKDIKKDIGDLTRAWVAGDAKTLNALLTKSYDKHPDLVEYQKKIIDDRNGPMAEKVEKYLKGDKTIFIIAGCAHMVGDKGIVHILEQHHFTVEQSAATREEAKNPK